MIDMSDTKPDTIRKLRVFLNGKEFGSWKIIGEAEHYFDPFKIEFKDQNGKKVSILATVPIMVIIE